MPKQNSSSSGEQRSKVKLLFVEGDLAPGEIQILATAFMAAARPAALPARAPARLSAPSSDGTGAHASEVEREVAIDVETETNVEAEDEVGSAALGPKASSGPRNYRKPKPVNIDMGAATKSWAEFSKAKAPDSHRSRYLVAAAWLHDYAGIPAVTVDHVYTLYKLAGWTFDVSDPGAFLRQLKSGGSGSMAKGTFSINHIGLAEVEKLNANAL
jgi:hypothetical protein